MSSVLEVSRPAVEPVSVAEAVHFLKLPPDVRDLPLVRRTIIPAARRHIENATGLVLASRNFVQYEDGFPNIIQSFSAPYAPLFGAAFPWFFGYGPIASYPAPGVGGLQEMASQAPFAKNLKRTPVTAVAKILYVGEDGDLHGILPGTDFVVDFSSQPGRISPMPGSRWPISLFGANTVQVFFTAGYTAGADDTEDIKMGAEWQPLYALSQYAYVIDDNGDLELQTAASGTTGKTQPTWAAAGATVQDGSCVWLNCGPVGGAYETGVAYPPDSVVADPNGNLQFTSAGLTSGGVATWGNSVGAVTPDNGGDWVCLGAQLAEGEEPPNQVVEYQGDTGIPDDLKMGILLMVSHFYFNRDPVTGGSVSDVPHSVTSICDSNRVYGFEAVGN